MRVTTLALCCRRFFGRFPERQNGKTLGGSLERVINKPTADVCVADDTFFVAEDIIALAEQRCMLTTCTATFDFGSVVAFFHCLTSEIAFIMPLFYYIYYVI